MQGCHFLGGMAEFRLLKMLRWRKNKDFRQVKNCSATDVLLRLFCEIPVSSQLRRRFREISSIARYLQSQRDLDTAILEKLKTVKQ